MLTDRFQDCDISDLINHWMQIFFSVMRMVDRCGFIILEFHQKGRAFISGGVSCLHFSFHKRYLALLLGLA